MCGNSDGRNNGLQVFTMAPKKKGPTRKFLLLTYSFNFKILKSLKLLGMWTTRNCHQIQHMYTPFTAFETLRPEMTIFFGKLKFVGKTMQF
jgi:hypothetical protein